MKRINQKRLTFVEVLFREFLGILARKSRFQANLLSQNIDSFVVSVLPTVANMVPLHVFCKCLHMIMLVCCIVNQITRADMYIRNQLS